MCKAMEDMRNEAIRECSICRKVFLGDNDKGLNFYK